ncbi:MAG: lipopolysaccharide heptosyltransferase II [Candidatus Omnitrophica bacterium]|nr:lipopolysaccharide heptosyltransferase II [Candidatus Omnitrophota bacterium]
MVKKILFITLSNIGDVIMTLPALDTLREHFPQAKITCLVGPRPRQIFEENPFIDRLMIFDKHAGVAQNFRLFKELKKEKFDMVVDLRNSAFGVLLPARYKIPMFLRIPVKIKHMKDRHLYKVESILRRGKFFRPPESRETSLFIGPQEEMRMKYLLQKSGIKNNDRIITVSLGARSHIKRWSKEKFSELISALVGELRAKVILVGDKEDRSLAEYVQSHAPYPLLDLTAQTSLKELAYLLKSSRLLITNDSACLHMGSYVNVPVLAVFGPTDEDKYGPWSDNSRVAKKDVPCRPCRKAQCSLGTLNCTSAVKTQEVLDYIKDVLDNPAYPLPRAESAVAARKGSLKRILIVRTDRIGDVLLSTPVIKALRQAYPHSFISMMVSPYAREIVDGNPYLDEVIVFDKDNLHRGWFAAMKFALNLKKKKYDLAVILHPSVRVHLLIFFSGVRRRLGYARKFGFLLTDRIKHLKQLGQKHEMEYNLELLQYLGIMPKDAGLFMPIKKESELWAQELLERSGIAKDAPLLAIHPGASCPSKIWPCGRFAQVSDRLIRKYGFKVLLVAGPKDIFLAQEVAKRMENEAYNFAGMTSLSQLASLLKKCRLFISNDSGPVHIASAVGTPTISIFGRSQKGLSPVRWGPLGNKDRVAHSTVGCVECLAHNCVKGFACLRAVTVDYVVNIADSMLKE